MKRTESDEIFAAALEADGLPDELDNIGPGQHQRFTFAAVGWIHERARRLKTVRAQTKPNHPASSEGQARITDPAGALTQVPTRRNVLSDGADKANIALDFARVK